MSDNFKHIGLIGKLGDPAVGDTLVRLGERLLEHGAEVVVEAATARELPGTGLRVVSMDELARQCDLAITVGGDGTLLHAARAVVDHGTALLGINLGRLGFLVDISPDQMQVRIKEVLSGQYLEEQRILLTVSIENPNAAPRQNYAFNDVVVHKWEVARMIETDTFIDGDLLNTMRSDGLIVSTPTGSTAYALSGGGPIIDPDMDAMVIVPICPHSMSYRPIVIDGKSKVEIMVRDATATNAQVTCDGQLNMPLQPGDKIRVQRHSKWVRIIHPPEHDHYQVLRAKLHWGEHS